MDLNVKTKATMFAALFLIVRYLSCLENHFVSLINLLINLWRTSCSLRSRLIITTRHIKQDWELSYKRVELYKESIAYAYRQTKRDLFFDFFHRYYNYYVLELEMREMLSEMILRNQTHLTIFIITWLTTLNVKITLFGFIKKKTFIMLFIKDATELTHTLFYAILHKFA
jgi:hypothetical protein